MKFPLVKFDGKEYLVILGRGETLLDGSGAISTVEQFEHGLPSHAHLFEDGQIKRYNEVIGQRSDLKFIRDYEPTEMPDAMFNTFFHPGWNRS